MIEKDLIPNNPIITVKEARKLLGRNWRKLSDRQIKDLIKELSTLANIQKQKF